MVRTRKERETTALVSSEGQNAVAVPVRQRGESREFTLDPMKMRRIPVRFAKTSHTVATDVDESCSSSRRDPRLRGLP